jgi:hypothetical protein
MVMSPTTSRSGSLAAIAVLNPSSMTDGKDKKGSRILACGFGLSWAAIILSESGGSEFDVPEPEFRVYIWGSCNE